LKTSEERKRQLFTSCEHITTALRELNHTIKEYPNITWVDELLLETLNEMSQSIQNSFTRCNAKLGIIIASAHGPQKTKE